MNDVLHEKYVASAEAFLTQDPNAFDPTTNFKKLKPEKKNVAWFRNTLLLPPFVLTTMLAVSSRDSHVLACSISSASQIFCDQCKNDPEFCEDDHKCAANDVI